MIVQQLARLITPHSIVLLTVRRQKRFICMCSISFS